MVPAEELECLKAIALMGGCRGPVFVSSQTIGEVLGASPQTASRRLKSFERQELISRSLNPDGQHITITKRGENELRREYTDYCRLFGHDGSHYELSGVVINGLGEGKYYMSLDPYRKQFLRHLGFEPFSGTLNLSSPARVSLQEKRWRH